MYGCIKGRLYEIDGRNFDLGVYDGNEGFLGIRHKFGFNFLDKEYHYDQGPPYGTVHVVKDTGIDFVDGEISEDNDNLFIFLKKKVEIQQEQSRKKVDERIARRLKKRKEK